MNKIISKMLSPFARKHSYRERGYWGKFEGYFAIVFNVILFGIKLFVGLASGSIAIIADAVHTLSDLFSSIAVVWGFKLASAPPDKKHPFGHAKIEQITTLSIAFLLFYTGIEFMKSSLKAISNPHIVKYTPIFLVVIFISLLIKELMAEVALFIGKKCNSDTLKADAMHHRTDVLSSIIVIPTFFIKGIDGYLGLAVSLFILYSAYEVAKDSINFLIGTSPDVDFVDDLKKKVLEFEFVEGIHDVIVNNYGNIKIVSFHVEMDINLSFDQAHHYSEVVESVIDRTYNVKSVVHIDPIDKNDPLLNDIAQFLNSFLDNYEFVDSFHDLRKIGRLTVNIVFDINIKREITEKEESEFLFSLETVIKKEFPIVKNIVVKIEPLFAY